jgi:tetratricopeptide (TPR) repeat protein
MGDAKPIHQPSEKDWETSKWLKTLSGPIGLMSVSLAMLVLLALLPNAYSDDAADEWSVHATVYFLALLSLCAPAWLMVTLNHELGHLLGGLIARYHFWLFVAGPLVIVRNERRVSIKLENRWAEPNGQTGMLPSDKNTALWQEVCYIAGGSLASCISGLLFLWGWLHAERNSYPELVLWLFALLLVSFSAIVVVLGTLLRSRSRATDGALLRMVIKDPEAALRWQTTSLLLSTSIIGGKRPRDWDPDAIETILQATDKRRAAHAYYLAHIWALDQGNIELAEEYLDRSIEILENLRSPRNHPFLLHAVYFEAYHRRNVKRARSWFEMIKEDVGARSSQQRAEAAISLAEERYEDACTCALAGLKAIRDEGSYDTALGEMETEWFQAILSEAEQGLREAEKALVSESER